MITEELIEEIKNKIVSSILPDKIILFGSQASGKAKKESDIDLVIIRDTAEPQHRRNLIVRRLFPGRNFSLDVFVFTPKEEREFRDIRGTILYTAFKNGKIICNIMKNPNEEIVRYPDAFYEPALEEAKYSEIATKIREIILNKVRI